MGGAVETGSERTHEDILAYGSMCGNTKEQERGREMERGI